jgi:hypothetical protein
MAAPLAKRMQIKPGQTILAVNAPAEYEARLGELPEGARLVTRGDPARADHVHVFVRDSKELARHGPKAIAGAHGGAVTWIAYPKKTSGVETDMTRDRGWDAVTAEIDAVSQVAVDDIWSALRFKAVADVGRRGERGARR